MKNISIVILLVALLGSVFYVNQGSSKKTMKASLNGKADKVPNIRMQNTAGEEVELYKVMKNHKLILIDFWASWCGPCRAENPNVVKSYKAYKDKGFTIFSVSLDESKTKWEKAIKDDGLAWQYHVSDLLGWDNAAAIEYGVEGIPMNYLINSEGEIIAQDLRGKDLENAIANALNK